MIPIIGTSIIRFHQPLLFVSCSLLVDTARDGNRSAKLKISDNIPESYVPIITSINVITIPNNKTNNVKYQNSDLVALPLKLK